MMSSNHLRAFVLLIAAQSALGCSRFVWKEDPFTPDQAPMSEIIAAGRDTTYVLRAPSYYLLAQKRSALWNREVMDDVAWRYRALFGDPPPPIAIRLDTAAATSPTDSTWRGMPLATIAPRRRPASGDRAREEREQRAAEDSVRAQIGMRPLIAATAAEAWLEARVLALRGTDSQPGGAEPLGPAAGSLPAWIEAGALRILASGGAPDRAAAELRANEKVIVPLASLSAVTWQRKPNAADIARVGPFPLDEDGDARFIDGMPQGARQRRDTVPGVSPTFIAQSVSLLAFIHERDAGLVNRLAEELPRGASVETVLASSKTLPHDVSALDADWRKWLERTAKRR